jgi:hypothetical protein
LSSPAAREDKIKRERIALYFDCICGATSAIFSITCIIFFAIKEGIPYPDRFSFGLTFWIIWLIFSLVLIGIGLSQYYHEKHYHEKKPRKDIKAPFVS